jgi:tryptophanyl-tRNA synthetase
VFPVIEAKLGRVRRLVGTGAPSPETGQLLKMSKSLNNAIFLSDDADGVRKKVMGMYTDPNRKRATDPGETDPEKNPLWAYHETFNPDKAWVAEYQAKYKAGGVGDVEVKKKLVEVLVALIEPMRLRRAEFEKDMGAVMRVLHEGTARANAVAEETLLLAKRAMGQDYWPRKVTLG